MLTSILLQSFALIVAIVAIGQLIAWLISRKSKSTPDQSGNGVK